MEPQGRERLGAAKRSGELFRTEALPCHQRHHVAVLWPQPNQGLPNGAIEDQRLGDVTNRCVAREGSGRQAMSKCPSTGIGPPLFRQHPSGYSDQPRKSVSGNLVEAPPGHEEGARYDVRGVIPSGPGQHIGQEMAHVVPVENLESRSIVLVHSPSPNAPAQVMAGSPKIFHLGTGPNSEEVRVPVISGRLPDEAALSSDARSIVDRPNDGLHDWWIRHSSGELSGT